MKKTAITILGILPLALIFLISFFGRAFTPNSYIPVERIEIDAVVQPYIRQHETLALKYEIFPMKASDQRVVFTSSDENVASVSDDGLVSALKSGFTTITAATKDGNKNSKVGIMVIDVVEGVAIFIKDAPEEFDNKPSVSTSLKLQAIVSPSSAYNQKVIWSSSNPAIGSIDQNGNYKALDGGLVTITVTTEEGEFTNSITFENVFDFGDSVFLINNKNEKTFYKTSFLNLVMTDEIKNSEHSVNWSVNDHDIAQIIGDGDEINVQFKQEGSVTVTAELILGTEKYTQTVTIESIFEKKENIEIIYPEILDATLGGKVYLNVNPADALSEIRDVILVTGSADHLGIEKDSFGYYLIGKNYGQAAFEVFFNGVEEPRLYNIDIERNPDAINLKLAETKKNLPNYFIGMNQPYYLEYEILTASGFQYNPEAVSFAFKVGFFGNKYTEEQAVNAGYIDFGSDRHTITFKQAGPLTILIETKNPNCKPVEFKFVVNAGMNITSKEQLQNGFQNENQQTIFNLLEDIYVEQTSETNVFETSKSITLYGNGYVIDATDVPVIAVHMSQGYNPPAVLMFKGTLEYGQNNQVNIYDLTVEGNLFKEGDDVERYYDSYLGIAFFPDEDPYNSGTANFSRKRYAKATLERVRIYRNFRNFYSENVDELVLTDFTAQYAYACNAIIGGYKKATLTNLSMGFTGNASLDITDWFGTIRPETPDKFPETYLKGRFDVCNWVGGDEPLFVVETQYAGFISTFAYPYMKYFRYFTPLGSNPGEKGLQRFNYAVSFYGANTDILYNSGVIDITGKETGNTKGLINMDDLENKASFGFSHPISGAMDNPSMGIFVIPEADGSIYPEGYNITNDPNQK
jgi:uncharacterized protein YjdB